MNDMLEEERVKDEAGKKVLKEAIRASKSKNDFVLLFKNILEGDLGKEVPYLKNASDIVKQSYAEKIWEMVN